MAKTKEFLTYKGKPLVRQGNVLYYGDMSDSYVAMLTVNSSKDFKDLSLADKVMIQIINTDPTVPPKELVIKSGERKNGLYDAVDVASIWLEKALKE